jgi:thiosulfate dehydrogenase
MQKIFFEKKERRSDFTCFGFSGNPVALILKNYGTMRQKNVSNKRVINFISGRIKVPVILIMMIGSVFLLETISCSPGDPSGKENGPDTSFAKLAELFTDEHVWTAPDSASIPDNEEGKLIRYGRTLMIHTDKYFGSQGSLSHNSNGMNCQNCHLDAGTRPYGNNLGSTYGTYPKFLPRSNSVISVAQKINECFSRSLNGTPIDTTSKEMQAYVAYVKWLGKDFKKGLTGSEGIKAPHLLDRAADPEKGRMDYEQLCSRCHGKDGQGQFVTDVLKDVSKQQGGNATKDDLYYYPPLWGSHSFNAVATLYRLSKFAGFIKNNMPYPMNYTNAVLTDEQAWDIAAYVNSQERPVKDHSMDYASNISKKPYDFPFPPYADKFTEEQHKFGPYTEMPSAHKAH